MKAAKVMPLLLIAVALTQGSGHVFAKTLTPEPVRVPSGSASTVRSNVADDQSKRGGVIPGRGGGSCHSHHGCEPSQPTQPGTTQPTCHGPHKGPNGVMIQCQ
jgi:hypothetical protein